MRNDKRDEIAKEYVDQQLDTMKKSGSTPDKLSKEEYKALIDEAAETVTCK